MLNGNKNEWVARTVMSLDFILLGLTNYVSRILDWMTKMEENRRQQNSQSISICTVSQSPSSHKWARWHLHMYRSAPQESNPQFREPTSFIMDTYPLWLLFQKEALSLSIKAVGYTNILEKRVWNKGSQCLCLQDIQKCKRPMRMSSNDDN